ncbi:hypothetical protein [Paenisporosarcina sp. TG20]|uniref:hypothetical protein n=1 Tax=Paenisporosarcina sp. TG20 TaxID=1211706 RepID=UPI00030D5F31|nr:hypothetical protein [Paenisporosarcina sp. TG20]
MKKIMLFVITSFFLAACSPTEEGSEPPTEQENSGDNNQSNSETQDGNTDKDNEKENNDENINEQQASLDKSEAEQVMRDYKNTFMDLVENSGENGKIINYGSKGEIVAYFTSAMSKGLASTYTDTYFREENGQLFLKAMDAPTWLAYDQSFTLDKIEQQKYQVIQERNNALTGHVNMTYELANKDDNWIVNNIDVERLGDRNDKESKNNDENLNDQQVSLDKSKVNLVENTGENGKMNNYESKDEIVAYFSSAMSKELATGYTDTYLREENGQLFLKAMDAPTWLAYDQSFTLDKIEQQKYQVIQERNNG